MPSSVWERASKAGLVLVAILGFGWGLLSFSSLPLREPARAEASGPNQPAPMSTPSTHVLASAGALPAAWSTPTETLKVVAEPTATPTPSSTDEGRASDTLAEPTLTMEPTQTPTSTPIHRPANEEPSRVTAPAIDLDAEVVSVGITEDYENGELKQLWDVADYAAGFHKGMAWPGHVGNTVISGHNNIRGEVFKDIHRLKPGNEVFVWVGNSPYRYRVSAAYRLPIKGAPPEVLEDNLRWIFPTDDQRLTLTTCWPPWSNTHRTVVVAFPVPWD